MTSTSVHKTIDVNSGYWTGPDEMEAVYHKKQDNKIREWRRKRKKYKKEQAQKEPPALMQDERFKTVDADAFEKKKGKIKKAR